MKKKLLLRKSDFKPSFPHWKVDGVFNPAAIRMENKKIMLYSRVAESSENHTSSALHCPVIISKEDYQAVDEKISREQVIGHDRNVIYLKSGLCRLTNLSHFRKSIWRAYARRIFYPQKAGLWRTYFSVA